jgi:hypothetical protein
LLVELNSGCIQKIKWIEVEVEVEGVVAVVAVRSCSGCVVRSCSGYVVGGIKIKAKLSPAGAGTLAELRKKQIIPKKNKEKQENPRKHTKNKEKTRKTKKTH